ncbi:hypothetical protein SAMN05421799_10913 [Alicyclobacillus vulcanalis]|uniref:Uncharacterized protein n=1 Tax=Alicyclobacillus vulcanalis TaxID=252246 RepID=A0A1N7NLW0_9BACL|nr:hypothetical protein SAMN05421799_10913 [Alicyclobacillus vulcanalis]
MGRGNRNIEFVWFQMDCIGNLMVVYGAPY